MRGKIRGLAALLVLLVLAGLAKGGNFLPTRKDVTQIKVLRTLALDAGESRLQLTAATALQRTGESGESHSPLILSQEGDTVSGGCFRLRQESDGSVELGHLAECVVGEELARQGIGGVADFFSRDFSMRLQTKLFLLRGGTAAEAVEGTASKNSALTDRLTAISQEESIGGESWPYTFQELLLQTEDNGWALAPVLTLEDNPDYDPEQPQEAPEKEVALSGLALLREGVLTAYLDEKESKGAALLLGRNTLDTVEVALSDGSKAALLMTDCSRKLIPYYNEGGALEKLTITLSAQGEISEISGGADPTDPAVLAEMEAAFGRRLEEWCRAALDLSRELGADYLHLRRDLVVQCPLAASRIMECWPEWFPDLEMTVQGGGEILRSYDIDRPMEEGGEGKE